MGWEWNVYGPPELHGWVWTEGQWHWGAAHTWHVVDCTWPYYMHGPGFSFPPEHNVYFWICNHWGWMRDDTNLSGGYWLRHEMHTYEELDETNIDNWMVHPLAPEHRFHDICNVRNIT